jgi:hypothetical protein
MAMVQSGEMQRMQAYAARASRLYQAGVDTPGTLRTASFGPASPMIDGVPVQYRVSVEPAGAAPYDVDSDQVVDDSLARALTPGRRLTVRVDPADPRSLMIWGVDAPTPPDDKRAQRMAKLQSLLALGVVTQAEFDVAQQKI